MSVPLHGSTLVGGRAPLTSPSNPTMPQQCQSERECQQERFSVLLFESLPSPCPAGPADLSPKTMDWQDEELFGQMRELKKSNPALKIMVSIGGS